MQITVIGAGNVGCVYGANLSRIGQDVAMIDVWEEHVRRIQERGLDVDGLHGSFVARVAASTDPRAVPKSDVALICVNTYSTRDAANAARILLKDSGFALTLQNGMGNVEILSEVLGAGRVMAALCYNSADLRGPGAITHTINGPTYIGELDRSRSQRLSEICDLLEQAGMKPSAVDDIRSTIWGKFIHNCGINAICAMTGLRPAHIHEVPALDEFQTHIINEAIALVKAKGVNVPDADPLAAIKEFCMTKFHRVSMLQHLERNRLTEIDALNGYIVRESERLGLAAPYNAALTALIKGREYRPAEKAAS